jgi:hypothetical protein
MTISPVRRTASSRDIPSAIKALRDANQTLTSRMNSRQWAGPAVHVWIQDAGVLFSDRQHGGEMHAIAQRLTKEGRDYGVRLAVDF